MLKIEKHACSSHSAHAAFCMEIAGFDVNVFGFVNKDKDKGYVVARFWENGLYLLDNAARRGKPKGIRGPFKSYREMGEFVGSEWSWPVTHIWAYPWKEYYHKSGNLPFRESLK